MTFPMSYRKVKSEEKFFLSYDTFLVCKHIQTSLLCTIMYYLHKPYKKNYLKYFILTVPLLWRDLCDCQSQDQKNIFLSFKTAGLHFRSVCLSYFEIHNLTVPKNFTLFSKHVTHWNQFIYSGVQCHIAFSSAN